MRQAAQAKWSAFNNWLLDSEGLYNTKVVAGYILFIACMLTPFLGVATLITRVVSDSEPKVLIGITMIFAVMLFLVVALGLGWGVYEILTDTTVYKSDRMAVVVLAFLSGVFAGFLVFASMVLLNNFGEGPSWATTTVLTVLAVLFVVEVVLIVLVLVSLSDDPPVDDLDTFYGSQYDYSGGSNRAP